MRLNFGIATDTGTWADVSPNLFGELRQIAWKPATGDTGADLQIVMLPTRSDDPGSGRLVFDDSDCSGVDFLKAPRKRQHGSDGNANPADTGAQF